MDYRKQMLTEAEQIALDRMKQEDSFRSSYDTLYGCLVGAIPELGSRMPMVRHLDKLYEGSLCSIPDSPGERAETAEAKTMFPREPSGASTASSTTPSGSSQGASSRDPSYSPADEDTGHR